MAVRPVIPSGPRLVVETPQPLALMRLGKESTRRTFCEAVLKQAKQTFADTAYALNFPLGVECIAVVQAGNQ